MINGATRSTVAEYLVNESAGDLPQPCPDTNLLLYVIYAIVSSLFIYINNKHLINSSF